jgi:predicted TIM-barrel fold metal-dependent hydrolase
MVHPSISFDPRLEIIPNNYQYNNVTEEYLASQLLTHSNVFDQFPRLKIVICHFGGALDRFVRGDTGHLSQKGYGTNLFFDTCAYDDAFVEAAVKQKGVDACVFGTEAPGSGGAIHPATGKPSDEHCVDQIGSLPFLTHEQRLQILQGNPLKVFNRIKRDVALKVGAATV